MAYWKESKRKANYKWDNVKNQNKYHNIKFEMDGEKFDSQKEARIWAELKLLEKAKEISDLKRQVKYELIPNQYINGKLIERKCEYIADFTYVENGKLIVVDAKSEITKTPTYKIKKKLMLYIHGIQIKEV